MFIAECYHSLSLCSSQPAKLQDIATNQSKGLSIAELAECLKIGRTKLYRMAQEGKIPAPKVGSQWRFSREEIDLWMRDQRSAKSDTSLEKAR